MTPSNLASQLDLYAESHQIEADKHAARATEYDAKPHVVGHDTIALYAAIQRDKSLMAVHKLHNAARMIREYLVPQWTTTIPTKEGVYWRCWYGDGENAELVDVAFDPKTGGSMGDHLGAYRLPRPRRGYLAYAGNREPQLPRPVVGTDRAAS